jgi:hypothetical protein
MCMFCRSLFVLLSFFFWPWGCLFLFDLQILITPLVSLYCVSFSFICIFCRSLFVLLYFFFWLLCCLFFDIRILNTPLASSNSSFNCIWCVWLEASSKLSLHNMQPFGFSLRFNYYVPINVVMILFQWWYDLEPSYVSSLFFFLTRQEVHLVLKIVVYNRQLLSS